MLSDIDELLVNINDELKRINTRLDELEGKGNIEILGTKEVAQILGINKNAAGKLFKESGFPRLPNCKSNKVEKQAFLRYIRNEEADNNARKNIAKGNSFVE